MAMLKKAGATTTIVLDSDKFGIHGSDIQEIDGCAGRPSMAAENYPFTARL
jgi:hypothetical protein